MEADHIDPCTWTHQAAVTEKWTRKVERIDLPQYNPIYKPSLSADDTNSRVRWTCPTSSWTLRRPVNWWRSTSSTVLTNSSSWTDSRWWENDRLSVQETFGPGSRKQNGVNFDNKTQQQDLFVTLVENNKKACDRLKRCDVCIFVRKKEARKEGRDQCRGNLMWHPMHWEKSMLPYTCTAHPFVILSLSLVYKTLLPAAIAFFSNVWILCTVFFQGLSGLETIFQTGDIHGMTDTLRWRASGGLCAQKHVHLLWCRQKGCSVFPTLFVVQFQICRITEIKNILRKHTCVIFLLPLLHVWASVCPRGVTPSLWGLQQLGVTLEGNDRSSGGCVGCMDPQKISSTPRCTACCKKQLVPTHSPSAAPSIPVECRATEPSPD